MFRKLFLAAAVATVTFATNAGAVTVATGTTQAGDTDNIDLVGPATSVISPGQHPSFGSQPGADWVWAPGAFAHTAHSFSFNFDLTGFDLGTVMLSGLVLVDNTVDILLNGTSIFALSDLIVGNFTAPNPFATNVSNLFNAGANEVIFNVADAGGGYGFNASIDVSADAITSPVPLPAGGALLLGGLLMLHAGRKRRS